MTYWGVKRRDENIIQIWHFGECNINFYCTLINDIAQGACKGIDITQNQSVKFVLLYAYRSFTLNKLLILRIMKM